MTMPENSAPGLMVLIGAILTGVGIAALGSCMAMRPRDVPEMLKLGASLLGIGVPLLLFGLHGRRRASTQTSSDVYKRYQGTGVLFAAYGLTMVFNGPGQATGRLLLFGGTALAGMAAYVFAPWLEKHAAGVMRDRE